MTQTGNTGFLGRLVGFLGELRRRKVYRVAVVYLIGAVAGLELMDALVPASRLPEWADEMFLGLAVFGFPLVVILAWAFEVTPEGLRLTEPAEAPSGSGKAWQAAALVLVLLATAGVWDYLTRDPASAAESKGASTDRSAATPVQSGVGQQSRQRPFVAVLPLENLSPDEENAYFAAGVHEEILSQLSKISGLGVFARTTMNQYRDTNRSILEIGRELSAAAVLEGSVRRAGDRVRITIQLIDAQSQDHLWAETYDRQLVDVFSVQEDIARRVVDSLAATLSPDEDSRISRRPTASVAAFDLYLMGRAALHRFTFEDNLEAERLFRRALELDPEYALAWAGLGRTFAQRDGRLGYPHGSPAKQAIGYARKALALDPVLAEGHDALGNAQQRLGNREAALAAYLEALRYDPNHAGAARGAAEIYYSIGQFDQSLRFAKRAARLMPDSVSLLNLVAHVYKFLRMDEAAMRWLDRALMLEPGHYWPRLLQAQYDTYRGACESAMARVQALIQDLPDVPYAWTGAAAHAYMCGHYAQAAEWARHSLELAPENIAGYWHETPVLLALAQKHASEPTGQELMFERTLQDLEARVSSGERFWGIQWDLAALQAANGEAERAIDTLERAYQEGFRFVRWPPHEIAFVNIRENPRFLRLMEQMEKDVTAMRERVVEEERG